MRLSETAESEKVVANRYGPVTLPVFPAERAQMYHQLATSDTTYLHCALAASQIRLIQAQTGQLPETLPEGLPKDPFTGEDFRYERTDEGFILRFDPQSLSGIRVHEFAFKVSDP